MIAKEKNMATNKLNVDNVSSNLFMLAGDEEQSTPYGWDDMPEFDQPDGEAFHKIIVRFRGEEDLKKFAKLMEQNFVTTKTKSIWYPQLDKKRNSLLRWMDNE